MRDIRRFATFLGLAVILAATVVAASSPLSFPNRRPILKSDSNWRLFEAESDEFQEVEKVEAGLVRSSVRHDTSFDPMSEFGGSLRQAIDVETGR